MRIRTPGPSDLFRPRNCAPARAKACGLLWPWNKVACPKTPDKLFPNCHTRVGCCLPASETSPVRSVSSGQSGQAGFFMKMQGLMLGCAATLCLAAPAVAGTGLYIGLGAGWDGQNDIRVDQFLPPPATGTLTT